MRPTPKAQPQLFRFLFLILDSIDMASTALVDERNYSVGYSDAIALVLQYDSIVEGL